MATKQFDESTGELAVQYLREMGIERPSARQIHGMVEQKVMRNVLQEWASEECDVSAGGMRADAA